MHRIRSIRVLGVRIDCVRLPQLLSAVLDAVKTAAPIEVLYANVHTVNLATRYDSYRSLLDDATLLYCDGTGVRLGARLLGLHIPERMTGADWIHDLCRMAIREDLSLFLLGSPAGVAGQATAVLLVRYPGLRIAGWASGFGLTDDTVDRINACHPDILLVGMGSPRQERWIAEHREALDAPVLWAVGALFEFVSGRIRRGPRWMTDNGLEWLCRLAVEPGKLWRRYLIGNPVFVLRILRERVRLTRA